MSKRIGNILERHYQAKMRIAYEKNLLYKTLAMLVMSFIFIFLKLLMLYLILVKLNVSDFVWVLFWIQIPFILGLDLLERVIFNRQIRGLE